MKRFLRLGMVLCLLAAWVGCGDTFRPIIIPNPPAFPDPRAAHTVIALNNNDFGANQPNSGTVMEIDVSGDSVIGVATVGFSPVHAMQQTATQVLAVNQADASITKLSFPGGVITPTTISLPQGSAPNFVAVTPNDTTAYVSMPNATPSPQVAVVNTTQNSVPAVINVGANPVALAVTPDRKRLYVANQGDGTLNAFNTIDRSARQLCFANTQTCSTSLKLSSPPIWLLSRSDSQEVYALETNGSVAAINTISTQDEVTEVPIGVAGAAYMVYDSLLNRLYVPSADQLTVVDVSGALPSVLAAPIIPTVAPSSRGSQDPCARTATGPLTAVAAAALPDRSRAYVGAFYTDSKGNLCPQVTVINTSSNTIKTSTAVPGFPGFAPFSPAVCSSTRFRFTMAAAGDSSRVYLASCDGGNVNFIQTFDDTYLLHIAAPLSARAPIPPNTQPPPQNPVFLIAGP